MRKKNYLLAGSRISLKIRGKREFSSKIHMIMRRKIHKCLVVQVMKKGNLRNISEKAHQVLR